MDSNRHSPSSIRLLSWLLIVLGIVVTATASSKTSLRGWFGGSGHSPVSVDHAAIAVATVIGQTNVTPAAANPHRQDDHAGHDHAGHDHAGHAGSHRERDRSEEEFIDLTAQARASLDLEIEALTLSKFVHYQSLPATIIDWPGRTHLVVTAPMTGVVGAIYVTPGEVIRSGQRLFLMRLTHFS